ncbi:MAG: hypothetical protein AB7R55_08285 [Gemmatimonadales bacterium]
MKGCLTLPFRLFTLAVLLLAGYLAWHNRDGIRRWVHRATADPGGSAPEVRESPDALRARARARLDSLERRRADSVILSAGEVETLVRDAIPAEGRSVVDSVSLELGRGEVTLRAVIDGSKLPAGSLGPLTDWVSGRESVEGRGVLALRRLGVGEWRLEGMRVRGLPLPRPLWSRLLAMVVPVDDGAFTFDVPAWVTGIRVSREGAVLYGRRVER